MERAIDHIGNEIHVGDLLSPDKDPSRPAMIYVKDINKGFITLSWIIESFYSEDIKFTVEYFSKTAWVYNKEQQDVSNYSNQRIR